MDLLRTWILGVTAAAMVLSAAQALMPEGAVKRVGRMTGGLVLALAMLQPLTGLDRIGLPEELAALPEVSAGETAGDMTPIIEEELASYIARKAGELGAACTAEVTCVPDKNGVPIPDSAAVTGAFSAEQQRSLSDLIARDLGIPADRQTFREE